LLESKRRAIIFFIIAILLAALSGYFVFDKVKDLNQNLGTTVKVYIADRHIYSRAILNQADFTPTEIPSKYVREEYITNLDDLINQVSIVPLEKGQIITRNMLKEATAVTEEDNRLITIMEGGSIVFDEPLTANDRVDIIVSRQENGEIVTEIFMEDVKVARVTAGDFKGVQLEVPFEDVTELIHMQHYAEVFRVIRANVGQMPSNSNSNSDDEVQEDEDSKIDTETDEPEKEEESKSSE
jgi:Flp pilus assembly protein CpaB